MTTENPQISVIVPVYKVERYLPRCLDSIVAQTFTDWECILIDDGSPDNSGAICDEYAKQDSRFVVIHQENAGVSAARNAGLDAARGEWIAFVDSDDWVELEFLQEQYNDIVSGDYDVCVCGLYGRGKIRHVVLNRIAAKRHIFERNGFGGYSFLRLVRRRNVNKIRYNTSISYLEDSDFFYRLFDNCSKILWTDKPLYHYEMNDGSVTRQVGLTFQAQNAIKTLEDLIKYESNRKIKTCMQGSLYSFYLSCLLSYYQANSCDNDGYLVCLSYLRKNFFYIIFNTNVRFKQKICSILLLLNQDFTGSLFMKYYTRKKSHLNYHDT